MMLLSNLFYYSIFQYCLLYILDIYTDYLLREYLNIKMFVIYIRVFAFLVLKIIILLFLKIKSLGGIYYDRRIKIIDYYFF